MDIDRDSVVSTLIDLSETLKEKALELETDETGNVEELVTRGKNLQKKKKKRLPTSKKNDEEIEMSFCEMELNSRGVYKRCSPAFEVLVKRSDFYNEVISKVLIALKLDGESYQYHLLRMSGAVIPDDNIFFGRSESVWTLGRYLNKVHLSPDKLQLGIGLQLTEDCPKKKRRDDDSSIPCDGGSKSILNSTQNQSRERDVLLSDGNTSEATSAVIPITSRQSNISQPCRPSPFYIHQGSVEVWPPPVLRISYQELCDLTHNFNSELIVGTGGFGKVYKVENFRCSGTSAAIKVLNRDMWNAIGMEFEVMALTKFRHPNIVELMGYAHCDEAIAIVYQFMVNGSLYNHLHKTLVPLSWKSRKSILIDSCRGLCYLHASNPPLVHQDIKSSNVLLDEHFVAKISDFGLSIDLPSVSEDKTLITAPMIARTEGYFPPEITSGKFSPKSDVFSYGVVVLETYSGLKAFDKERDDPKLTEATEDERKCAEQFKILADKKIETPPDMFFVEKVLQIINNCLQRHSKRPNSAQVLAMWD